jgi:hypothetical protein
VEYKNIILAWVAELVDARDLKSLGTCARTSSILVLGTKDLKGLWLFAEPLNFCFRARKSGFAPTLSPLLSLCRVMFSEI